MKMGLLFTRNYSIMLVKFVLGLDVPLTSLLGINGYK